MPLPALICLNNKLAVKAKGRRQQGCHRAEAVSELTWPCREHITRHTCSQGTMDSRLKCNRGNELGECLGGGFEVQAFSRRVVETADDFGEFGLGDGIEVGFA